MELNFLFAENNVGANYILWIVIMQLIDSYLFEIFPYSL